jgi:metal-responsive CopG/Arc/MetJ family transcriptional regulator
MKTAVSLPDDLYAEAEDLVRRLKTSRSELYASALREYVARHDPDAVTAALNRVYGEVDVEPDPALRAAGIETLKRVEW